MQEISVLFKPSVKRREKELALESYPRQPGYRLRLPKKTGWAKFQKVQTPSRRLALCETDALNSFAEEDCSGSEGEMGKGKGG